MMHKLKFSFDDILIFSFYLLILVLTFFTGISINKYCSGILILLIFIKVVRDGFGVRVSYTNRLNIIFYAIFIFVFSFQYIKYGTVMNVGLFSILSLILSIDFIKSLELNEVDIHRLVVAGLILLFSIVTLKSAGGWKYTYTTGAGGILSAFMVLAGFVMCYSSENKTLRVASYFLGALLLALSIRGPILSALLFIGLSRNFKVTMYLKAFIGMAVVLALVYLIAPESRIFDIHMSGRWIHWVMIWDEFYWSNLLYGMGDSSAADVLASHGMSGSMAAPHNEFLRIFYDFGLSGVVMLALGLIKMMGAIPKHRWAYFFALLIPFIFDNAFSYFFSFMFLFVLSGVMEKHIYCESKIERAKA